jgi:hypothetical protein
MSQFEINLPLENEESLNDFEEKLDDAATMQSLVKFYTCFAVFLGTP